MPALACLAVFFMALPQTGARTTIHLVRAHGGSAIRPATIQVDPGARLALVNDTTTTHAIFCASCPKGATFDTGDIQPGQTRFVTVDKEGSYDLRDRYAQEMSASLTVGAASAQSSGSPSPSPS